MNTPITHGKVCHKIKVTQTQTPVPVLDGPDTLTPTVTINFFIGSVCSEEILSVESAKELFEELSKIVNN